MSICNEITPTTKYTELLSTDGLTEDMVKLWRPHCRNIKGILEQNKKHMKAIVEAID